MAASLSHSHKFLFVPIPRTASVSISKSLSSFVDCKPLRDIYHPETKQLQKYFLEKGLGWEDYFSFSFVRNPWDRIISFFYKFKRESYDKPRDWIIEASELERAYEDVNIKLPPSQLQILESETGKIPFSFIGRFEKLEKDFGFICDKIGLQGVGLSHLNKSEHNCYQEYYDKTTKEIIRKKYNKEIELFGYKFDEN